MADAFISGLLHVLSGSALLYLLIGVVVGIIAGILPGIGGPVTLVILLPFALAVGDPFLAFALLLSAHTVMDVSNSIPAILFGIPGDNSAQANVLDGHPMARKGEAGRGIGATLTSALLGALFGALALAAAIPVVLWVIQIFGSPEFFMMVLWGLTMVGLLSGDAPLKGLSMGGFGLLLATVGLDPQRAVPRYTFGQAYLWDGLPLISITLGLFATPVIVELLQKKTLFSEDAKQVRTEVTDVMRGVRDTFLHWRVVLRNSVFGTWLGVVPGIGGSVIDWLAYGYTVQTSKDRENFGKGDVRGVIGPDSATSAKEGGALIPTVAFGIPGSTGMAILLGAFAGLGMVPGRAMLTENLDVTFSLVWILVISNVIAAVSLLLVARHVANIIHFKASLLTAIILFFIVLGAFMATRHLLDLVVLGIFSVLGYVMDRYGWPRPPLLLGFVIGGVLERYLFLSFNAYGFSWLLRPGVIAIALLMAVSMMGLRKRKTEPPALETSL